MTQYYKYFLTLVCSLLTGLLFAQITTVPEYPIQMDEVVLTFDATGTELEGYTETLYAHTGVILEGSSQWSHVIGEWGVNATQPELTSLGDDKYELLIAPSIETFYAIAPDEIVAQLAFVFRSGDGETQSTDIMVDIYSTELTCQFLLPVADYVVDESGFSFEVEVAAPYAEQIDLEVNGTVVATATGNTLTHTITIDAALTEWEEQEVVALATLSGQTAADTFYYARRGAPEIVALPAGMKQGINYIDDETVVLALYAPYHEYAFVIGGFNDWNLSPDYFMKYDDSQDIYWLEINGLVPLEEYIFQYLVDGEIRIGDPYADKISDPWNDPYIPASVYPNLKPYPSGETEEVATFLQTAQPDYPWIVEDFTSPDPNNLVIYELLIRDFDSTQSYKSVREKLSYLKTLGITALELMPVNEFDGNSSWGYAPSYHMAVDKYYGPKDELKALIDACHEQDIAVILDVVLNHAFGQNPFVKLWWNAEGDRPATNSPFFNEYATHDYNVGYDFNHESQQTKEYTKRVLEFWLEEYNIDGYRFDLSKGFTQNYTVGDIAAWSAYDQSRIDILSDYKNFIKSVEDDAIVILEHFADDSEEVVLTSNEMMVWGDLNDSYCEAAMGWTSSSDFGRISWTDRGFDQPHLVGYMESHDEERQAFKSLAYGNSSGSYNVQDTATAVERGGLCAGFFLTVPGPKMIWQFGEMGYDYSIEYGGDRTAPKPPRWDYLAKDYRYDLYQMYRTMIYLKNTYPVFNTSWFEVWAGGAQKSIKLFGTDETVIITGNFDVVGADSYPYFTQTGDWYEFFSQDTWDINDQGMGVYLEPGAFKIFSTFPIELPEFWQDPAEVEITYQVNMENELVAPEGVFVQIDDETVPMSADGTIWSVTRTEPLAIPLNYKFVNGTELEEFGGSCLPGGYGSYRTFMPIADMFTPMACFNSCVLCADPSYLPPMNLEASVVNSDDVLLTWELPEEGDPISYNIYRNGEVISSVTTLSFTDFDLQNAVYYFAVSAVYPLSESILTEEIEVEISVGVEESVKQNAVSIYPNPTSGSVTLESSEPIVSMRIYSSAGQLVWSEQTHSNRVSLETSRYANGVYIVHIQTEESTVIQKLIVK